MTICSLVLKAKPQNMEMVGDSLVSMQGVEIHAKDESGKIVITIEHPSREYCSRAMMSMSSIKGVLSTSLIYEYQEDIEDKQ